MPGNNSHNIHNNRYNQDEDKDYQDEDNQPKDISQTKFFKKNENLLNNTNKDNLNEILNRRSNSINLKQQHQYLSGPKFDLRNELALNSEKINSFYNKYSDNYEEINNNHKNNHNTYTGKRLDINYTPNINRKKEYDDYKHNRNNSKDMRVGQILDQSIRTAKEIYNYLNINVIVNINDTHQRKDEREYKIFPTNNLKKSVRKDKKYQKY